MRRIAATLGALCLLAACASIQSPTRPMSDDREGPILTTVHRGGDDLLSAGLGLEGLRAPSPPAFADPTAPTPAELRRRAIWTNWRGIVDLTEAGGFGRVYGAVPGVPGREYQAFAWLAGRRHPHRVLAQVPDAFDRALRCLVVTPVSGSRGVYGSIGFAGGWALPRGCAVVYTDKGAGTDVYDFDGGTGVALDGTRAPAGADALAFVPDGPPPQGPHRVAYRHAHSQENVEADWGRHTLQAMRFGLAALERAFPELAPFTVENTRVLLAGLSNGGGAVLRAAELPEAAAVAAVVAAAPQLAVAAARPLYDYASHAALYQPCALLDPRLADAPAPVPVAGLADKAARRCAALHARGLLSAGTPRAQAAEAYARLREFGFEEAALRASAIVNALDLWRSVGATYASAYARGSAAESICGYAFAPLDADGRPRAATAAERASWWADGAGVAPGAGIGILDALAAGEDPSLPGLLCARAAWTGDDPLARRVRAGVAETQASGLPVAPRVLIVHGRDDSLVPIAWSARAWYRTALAASPATELRLYEIANVQHFDAFLGLPALGAAYLPLLPYAWQALDAALAAVRDGRPLPPGGLVPTRPRGPGTPLTAAHLGDLGAAEPRDRGDRSERR